MAKENEGWPFISASENPLPSRAKQPMDYTQPDLGNNGYPNKIANTQTQKTRVTGAATKGTGHSKKMG
jgi:hypothetical protein